jgi:OPA family glycerol-3-phosphate transporter-like MFS transporter
MPPRSDRRAYTRWQRRVFIIAWLSYASFYLCRVNISVALPSIQADFGWDKSAIGLIGSTFLWLYALGQLVNGTLGQRADSRWFVGLGMLVSAACCAAFGAASWLWLMILLWGLNGWVQSMGWGPIVKTISAWFGDRRRGRITTFFAPCFVLGHLTAWAVGGWIVDRWGWRYAFWLPAIVFAGMAALWLLGIRSTPQAAGFDVLQESKPERHDTLRHIVASLWSNSQVRWAALTCVFASMIKDGLTLWAPFMLIDLSGGTTAEAALGASVMPLLGLAGSMLSGWLVDRVFGTREAPVVIVLSLLIAVAMLGFVVVRKSGTSWSLIGLLGVCGMMAYGINAVLLTSLPLSFSRAGNVAAVAGFLDFAAYVGGGISAVVVGQLLDGRGWNAVFVYWFAATLLASGGGLMLRRHS